MKLVNESLDRVLKGKTPDEILSDEKKMLNLLADLAIDYGWFADFEEAYEYFYDKWDFIQERVSYGYDIEELLSEFEDDFI